MTEKDWVKIALATACIFAATYLYSRDKSGAGWLLLFGFLLLAA